MAMMMVLFMHDQELCKFFWIKVPVKYITAAVIYSLIATRQEWLNSVDEIFW